MAPRASPRSAFALLLVGAMTSCGSCKHGTLADAGASAAVSPVSDASSAPLSLPIAADQDPGGRVYVVGFVASESVVMASLYDAGGRLLWNARALDALAFSSDAHVDVIATTHGAVVAWRGLRQGKRTRVGRWVGDDGKVSDTTFDIGSNACATADDVVSIGGKGSGSLVVRHVPDGQDRTLMSIPEGVEPSLICGDGKRAYLVEQGEDALVARPVEDGKVLPRVTLLADDDLGDDDVREREEFMVGERFGEIVLTEKGKFVVREIDASGVSPKRTLERTLAAEEGFMAADSNATDLAIIVSRDDGGRCDGDMATDVVATVVSREPAQKERSMDVAHGECGKDLGPYWVAPTNAALYVAWQVRGRRSGNHAPVEALAWSKLGDPTPHVVPLSAEDLVFAGCHENACAFVALVRPEGTDGMNPGAARVLFVP